MSDRKKVIVSSIAILSAVSFIVSMVAVKFLYQAAFDQERDRLVQVVMSQAGMIEAVARFDRNYAKDYPGGPQSATLSQVREALENYRGFGKTGEIAIARRENDSIVFLLRRLDSGMGQAEPIPFDSKLAEPMRRALSGQSGWMVGPDYRGATVLAAYAPIRELGLGMVAKTDLSEIRAPFVRAGTHAGAILFLLVVSGSLCFYFISNPIIKRVEDSEAQYRALVELAPDLIAVHTDGEIVYINPAGAALLGASSPAELTGRPLLEIISPECRDLGMERIRRVLGEKGRVPMAETRLIGLSGHTVDVETTAGFISYRGKPSILSVMRDITGRKDAERALNEHEQRYRALFEEAPIPYQSLDDEGRILEVNQTWLDALGYTRDEVLGRWFGEFLAPSSLGTFAERFPCFKELGHVSGVEFEMVRKGGELVFVCFEGKIGHDSQGRFRQTHCIFKDITEKRNAERDLRESRELLRLIIDSAPALISYVGSDYRFKFNNRTYVEWFGLPLSEITGKEVWDVLGEEAYGILKEYVEKALAGETASFELLSPYKTGGARFIRGSYTPHRDEDGTVRGFIVLANDITDRKRIEEALERQSTLLGSINRVFRKAILCETEEELAKTFLSVAEELTGSRFGFLGEIGADGLFYDLALSDPGWAACGRRGTDAARLIHDRKMKGLWGTVMKNGIPFITNEPSSHPDSAGVPEGHPPLKTFMGMPLKHGDRTFGMIALANKEPAYDHVDVQILESLSAAFVEALSRKRAEEDVRRARDELELRVDERTEELRKVNASLQSFTAKLEQSNQALQDFASIASHDLQEPLRKVTSFGNLLKQQHGDSLGEQGKDFLNRMLNATERMQTLLKSLLDYSRVSSRAEPFKKIELSTLIDEVLSDLEVRIEKSGGKVELGELPAIHADPNQMRQLFQNLIGNALKFHKEGEPPIVRISCTPAGDIGHGAGRGCGAGAGAGPGPEPTPEIAESVRIAIEDNGIGFDEKYLDRIFAPFQRLHGKSQYEGTGMGLAICKKIAERHGGSLTARSKPGEGATFVLTIPTRLAGAGGA